MEFPERPDSWFEPDMPHETPGMGRGRYSDEDEPDMEGNDE